MEVLKIHRWSIVDLALILYVHTHSAEKRHTRPRYLIVITYFHYFWMSNLTCPCCVISSFIYSIVDSLLIHRWSTFDPSLIHRWFIVNPSLIHLRSIVNPLLIHCWSIVDLTCSHMFSWDNSWKASFIEWNKKKHTNYDCYIWCVHAVLSSFSHSI